VVWGVPPGHPQIVGMTPAPVRNGGRWLVSHLFRKDSGQRGWQSLLSFIVFEGLCGITHVKECTTCLLIHIENIGLGDHF
jgi:hypothetical protein